MNVEISFACGKMLALLSGELDHHTAASARLAIDMAVDAKCPCELYLDFSGVTFMDSSGVGLVMGRYRILREYGATLYIANCRGSVRKVMLLSGMNKLAGFVDGDIKQKLFCPAHDENNGQNELSETIIKGEMSNEKIRQDIK